MSKGVFRSPAAVIVFTIITCGIYSFIWIYKFGHELKAFLEDDTVSPGMDVFLSIVCFPYLIYLAYHYGELLKKALLRADISVEQDSSILYLVIAILGLFIIDMAIMQSKANELWAKDVS